MEVVTPLELSKTWATIEVVEDMTLLGTHMHGYEVNLYYEGS